MGGASVGRIRDKLKMSFIFNALDGKELEVVVDAMEEKKFQSGAPVIKQGDEGDNLYVVDTGVLSCSRQFVKVPVTCRPKTRRPNSSRSTSREKPLESWPSCTTLQGRPRSSRRPTASSGAWTVPRSRTS